MLKSNFVLNKIGFCLIYLERLGSDEMNIWVRMFRREFSLNESSFQVGLVMLSCMTFHANYRKSRRNGETRLMSAILLGSFLNALRNGFRYPEQ